MEIQKYVELLLDKAIRQRVQDIYFLPKNDSYEISFRMSQSRVKERNISTKDGEKLILHFKFRAGMNVGEKRRAQLGAFSIEEHRFRLSTVGDFDARESLVIRILYAPIQEDFHYFFPEQYEQLSSAIQKRGLFLFSGPTGSGKTSTLYSLAKEFGQTTQIIAIEDPVEIQDESILQVQVNESIGMDYDALIKLCLRHRPDLLIIGEIRDEKTARATIRATLTGHSVFSTIHARSIQGVYDRLYELGIKKEELDQCLSGVIYQRLLEDTDKNHKVLFDLALDMKGGKLEKTSNIQQNLQLLYDKKIISKSTFQKETF
jgi:competence protein ComGA